MDKPAVRDIEQVFLIKLYVYMKANGYKSITIEAVKNLDVDMLDKEFVTHIDAL